METMRSTWTDERLDDLTRRMDLGFERVDTDIRELRAEMKSMQRTLFGMMATIVAGFLVTNL
jgi:hypothetical protein